MKLRRKSTPTTADEAASEGTETEGSETEGTETGPYDADALPDDGVERVDLGSLLIQPEPGRELRMQVDDRTGEVQAVMLVAADGALELRAFAAPRNGDLWSDIRPQIAADMVQRGGTAIEQEGPFGPELRCQIEVERPDGTPGVQPSRVMGFNGPRWLLRATLLGRPAMEPELATEWEAALTRVAVRRGAQAMRVGEPLAVVLPESARRVTPPAAPGAAPSAGA